MQYRVVTKTTTTTESEVDLSVPEVLAASDDVYDRAVHAQAKAGTLVAAGGRNLNSETTILEVWRGDLRIFPRVKKAKVTIKPLPKKDPLDE